MKAYTPEKVREIEDALESAKRWHQGDKWRFSDKHGEWEAQMDFLNAALATLRSGQDMEVVCQFHRKNEFFDTDPPTLYEQSIGWEPLYAIKPSKD
jgi:hypothetical protein